MPKAVERFDLTGYDLILSSSHCVAKGVKVPENSLHICYCYTPMRYMWDMFGQYFSSSRFYVKFAAKLIRPYLQKWDVESSKSVDYFIAISEYIRERIKRHYDRDADVIYPPVDTDFYTPADTSQSQIPGYYLIVSALVPYKRLDLAIGAFNKLGLKLKIIGSGPDEKRLKKMAGQNIEFLGWCDNETLRRHYRACKALLFPGEEDFGIVPVEAQACGKPILAYKKGGVLETVKEGTIGMFFERQDVDSIIATVKRFENAKFEASVIRNNSEKFSRRKFVETIKNYIDDKIKK